MSKSISDPGDKFPLPYPPTAITANVSDVVGFAIGKA